MRRRVGSGCGANCWSLVANPSSFPTLDKRALGEIQALLQLRNALLGFLREVVVRFGEVREPPVTGVRRFAT